MMIKLTPEQSKQLAPLFRKAELASDRGEKGIILLQPFSPDDPEPFTGNLSAAFIKHTLAVQIELLCKSNPNQIVKR